VVLVSGRRDDYHAERLRRRILPWADAGLIELTTGNAIDHGRIEATVLELAKKYDIRAIAFDPYNGEMLATRLTELGGLNMLRFPQNASQFNEPARALERAIAGGRLHHGGNPGAAVDGEQCRRHDERGRAHDAEPGRNPATRSTGLSP
jgi:phage terminase large subunit-like protein